jgi:hypothetical protein
LLLMVEPTSPTPPAPPPTLLFRLSDTSKMWCHSLRVKFPLFFGVGGFCFFGFLRVQFFCVCRRRLDVRSNDGAPRRK